MLEEQRKWREESSYARALRAQSKPDWTNLGRQQLGAYDVTTSEGSRHAYRAERGEGGVRMRGAFAGRKARHENRERRAAEGSNAEQDEHCGASANTVEGEGDTDDAGNLQQVGDESAADIVRSMQRLSLIHI